MKNSLITKQSVTLLFILGLLVLISTSILTYMNFRDQLVTKNVIVDTYARIGLLEEIQSVISDLDNFSNESTAPKNSAIKDENNKYLAFIKALSNSLTDYPQQLSNANELKNLIDNRFQLLNDAIELKGKSGKTNKYNKIMLDKEKVLELDIKAIINKMKKAELDNMTEKNEISEKSYKFAFSTFVAGIAISCLIFIGVFLLLKKNAQEIFAADTGEVTREELEQIVRERTAEISEINRKLYQKIELLEKTEDALKSSEQYYRTLFEQAHDAIIIFSPEDGKVLDLNRHACEIYGFTRNEFIGLSLKSISKNPPSTQEHIKETLKKGYNYNFQTVHYKKDSTEMLIEVNASVIRYSGKPAILSINRDITDRILKVI